MAEADVSRVGAAAPRPLAERLGIMQGRLLASRTGELDCSPGPRWREEFALASALGLNHIELVAERSPDPDNPIWSDAGRHELVTIAEEAEVRLVSLCVNESLNARFDDADFARDLCHRLVPVLAELHAIVVLPLLEASDLSILDRSVASSSVVLLAEALSRHGARLVLELGVPAEDALEFIEALASDVGLCYDIGNATALGLDVPGELRTLGTRVWHLHAKDKDHAGNNVRFGTGQVPFDRVFAELAAQRFDGLVTMEATRGDDPQRTASEHRAFLLSMQQSAMQSPEDAR